MYKISIIKKILSILLLFLIGCSQGEPNYGAYPFIEMEEETIVIGEHYDMCNNNPTSIFCKKSDSIGDIKPTKVYVIKTLTDMNSNFSYKEDNSWHYNQTVYEDLSGDCEDIASTMAQHMINDGIDKQYLHLAFRKLGDNEYHIFLAVDTSDAGILHVDYGNSGYSIEPKINFHMRMDNPGVYKWVKGNINNTGDN